MSVKALQRIAVIDDHAIPIQAQAVGVVLNRSVEELELSVRSYNCLKNANIQTIGDLVQKSESEMLRTKNFGRKSLNEIKEILSGLGLSFGMKFDAQGRLVGGAPPPPSDFGQNRNGLNAYISLMG